jgi:transcriptional regulator of acetoin/glycerol metabolism
MAERVAVTMPDSVVAPSAGDGRPLPGLLVVFSRDRPLYQPVVLGSREPLVLGRDGLCLPDERMSTRHAEVRWDASGFGVRDLDSRNGTFLDGVRVAGPVAGRAGGLLRMGQTLVLLLADLRRHVTGEVAVEADAVVGPTLRRMLDGVAMARREGGRLLVRGETGTGKELVARHYHQAAARKGPLVTFNCANFQAGLAEARLFGTVRGAFPEARDTEGLFMQADGGVLFLDEVAELEPQVQPKLLRALESGEVQRVGESAVRRVEVKVVSASHQRLQDRVDLGLFRQDLLFRLKQFEVEVPPLRDRPEEVPWLMQQVLKDRGQALHASLVEAALLRPWPGNVRELLQATQAAGSLAREQGSATVKVDHLATGAGLTGEGARSPRAAASASPGELGKEEVVAALAACDGNVTEAARQLGLHRNQLNRLRAKYGLMPPPRKREGSGALPDEDDGDLDSPE